MQSPDSSHLVWTGPLGGGVLLVDLVVELRGVHQQKIPNRPTHFGWCIL